MEKNQFSSKISLTVLKTNTFLFSYVILEKMFIDCKKIQDFEKEMSVFDDDGNFESH